MEFAPGFHVQRWTVDGAETWRHYPGARAAKQAFKDAVASGEFSDVLLLERIETNWTAEAEPAPALRLHAEWPAEECVPRHDDGPKPGRLTRTPEVAPGATSGNRAESVAPAPTSRGMHQRELFA